jgi:hypothetical protein
MALELDRVALAGAGTAPQPAWPCSENVFRHQRRDERRRACRLLQFLDAIFECRLENFEPNAIIHSVRHGEDAGEAVYGPVRRQDAGGRCRLTDARPACALAEQSRFP